MIQSSSLDPSDDTLLTSNAGLDFWGAAATGFAAFFSSSAWALASFNK